MACFKELVEWKENLFRKIFSFYMKLQVVALEKYVIS